VRPIGFLGKSRLDGARQLLPEVLETWRTQWCFIDEQAPAVSQCSAESVLAQQTGMDTLDWQKAQGRAGAIWLAGQQSDTWRDLLFGPLAVNVPDDATRQHLLRQAQLALANALLAELQQEGVTTLANEAPAMPGGPLGDRLALCLSVQSQQLYILIDAALLAHFLPALPAHDPLHKRQAAIAKAKVRLQVRLPLGEMQDLRPGDVLRARTELAQPLSLATEQAKVVAEGYLVRQHDHLALQLSN
jgi:hypothetical protein